RGRPSQEKREAGERIGAQAEEERVAERDHAAIADQEIEAHGEDRRDGDLADAILAGIAREPPGDQRGREQRRRKEPAPGRRNPDHAPRRAGNNPPGRSSSTSTMTA